MFDYQSFPQHLATSFCDYVDHLGKHRSITTRTKERAELVLAKVLKTPGTRSRVTLDPDITLTDYMENWLKQIRNLLLSK